RWEGYNLPLAAMAALRRPALALDVGAHPEVIGDAAHLCRDIAEMAEKAGTILESQTVAPRGSPLPSGREEGADVPPHELPGPPRDGLMHRHSSWLETLAPPAPLPGGRGVHIAAKRGSWSRIVDRH